MKIHKSFLLVAVTAALAGCQASVGSEPAYATYQPRTYERPRVESRWVTLADAYSAQTDRQFVTIGPRHGEFRRLRIEAVRGAPVIEQVAVEYADGARETQVVKINDRLAPGEGENIDLNGRVRVINRIIVYTDPSYRGSYSIYGT